MGVTPHKYLNDKRLQIAAEALINSESNGSTVADIGLMCGFRDPLYFSKMFRKRYGIAPRYYPEYCMKKAAARPGSDSSRVQL